MLRLLVLLTLLAGCRESLDVVLPNSLAVGDGQTEVIARPQLDIVVAMSGDSTGFNTFDLMQFFVNGANEVDGMVIGGNWAVFTVPAPGNDTFDLRLTRRTGSFVDEGTIVTQPYAGPLLDSVAPDTTRIGTTVTITGSGFAAGTPRVFFGGIESATVTPGSDTALTAVVPDEALPGLVWVLIDSQAAEGLVGFQPLDAMDQPIEPPDNRHIDALFPATGRTEAVIRVYGRNYDNSFFARWDNQNSQRVLNVQTITVDPIGEMLVCFAIPGRNVPAGDRDFTLRKDSTSTNILPFVVLE
ncbi:MAG: IPT/TIG domain-containing protein [Planctomycetota bacterium]|jgi:hypothetical protein